MNDLIKVGAIATTHGIKGEVKVFPTTDDPKRFLELKEVILDTGKEKKIFAIEHVKFFKNMVILKFKGIDNINDVEQYRQRELFITKEHAVPLGENEYFISDLMGLMVHTDEGEVLGSIEDVLQTAANDIYVVGREGEADILIPAIKECILDVDVEKGRMDVHLLPGLRDINKK